MEAVSKSPLVDRFFKRTLRRDASILGFVPKNKQKSESNKSSKEVFKRLIEERLVFPKNKDSDTTGIPVFKENVFNSEIVSKSVKFPERIRTSSGFETDLTFSNNLEKAFGQEIFSKEFLFLKN